MRRTGVAVVGLLVAGSLAAWAADTTPAKIAVIVGRKSFVTETSLDELRDVYLRRKRVWSNGRRAIPVNLPPDSPMRERFSMLVLGRSTRDVAPYWDMRWFEGITPPMVLPSAAAIRAYLGAEPGAIAYVSPADVDDTCRVLLVLGR